MLAAPAEAAPAEEPPKAPTPPPPAGKFINYPLKYRNVCQTFMF